MNPLKKLQNFGQSVYMDEIRRSWLHDGTLAKLIERDGLRGVTSNPSIFEKAIAQSDEYDDQIEELAKAGTDLETLYEALVVQDIQGAADTLRATYDASDGRFGFVSLEVDPNLARDTEGTIEEAKRLWQKVDRPNVFIKVPGTAEGLPAIEEILAAGINVNVTLLFSLEGYREVANAYLRGLERRAEAGKPLKNIASVASFFLSRIDVMVDPRLDEIAGEGGDKAELAERLRGQTAIANAKMAYQIYREVFGSSRFEQLADAEARTQRVLWASTSTKDPKYSDVKYVEALIGPDTINTMPMETLDAYRDHGNPAPRLEDDVPAAREHLERLEELGISMKQVTDDLESEGIEKFVKPFNSLMDTLREAVGKTPA